LDLQMVKLLRATALVVLCSAMGGVVSSASASTRVVGGSAVSNPGWTALVSVDLPAGETGLCGGELIARSWVLTAAHCAVSDAGAQVAPSDVTTWVGLDRASTATSANAQHVDRIVVDPAYASQSSYGDLAALHLTAPDSHDPVALGSPSDPSTGATASVLGWGITSSFIQQTSDTLQQVGAPILDGGACTAAYGTSYDVATMICAGAVRGQDSCNGDSGGPLAFSPTTASAVLLGTVDFGPDICGDGQPAVYQRVTDGAGALFLASTVPTAAIAPSIAAPAKNSTISATAASSGLDVPSYSWDLNGDGTYGDATGATVSVPIGAGATSIAVRATGADGNEAARQLTLTPVDTPVSATVPATVTEGHPLLVALATTGPGSGVVTAHASGHGIARTATATVPVARTLALTFPNDHVWHAPRKIHVALSATAQLTLASPATFTTTLVDNDKPRLRLTSARHSGSRRVSIVTKPPGAGTLTLRVMRAGRTLAHRTIRVTGTGSQKAQVKLTAAAAARVAGGRVSVRASWRSSTSPAATASAARALR
jgi:hypothetical protein